MRASRLRLTNAFDPQPREVLPVPVGAARCLAPTHLKHAQFGAAQVCVDRSRNRCLGERAAPARRRRDDLAICRLNKQNRFEVGGFAYGGRHAVDDDAVAFAHAVLPPANGDGGGESRLSLR